MCQSPNRKVRACAFHHTKWTLFGACNKTWHFACLNDLCISQMFALLQKVNQVEIDQVNSADSAFGIFINF